MVFGLRSAGWCSGALVGAGLLCAVLCRLLVALGCNDARWRWPGRLRLPWLMTPAGWRAGLVPGEELSGPYLAAIRRGFQFAGDLGCGCGPVHFLVGIAEGHGAAAAALDPGQGPSLRAVVPAAPNSR